MLDEILSLALNNGLWAALFCLLFLYQLKDSRTREKKYSATIDSLSNSLLSVKEISGSCVSISQTLNAVKEDCGEIKAECRQIKSECRQIKADCGIIKKGKKPIGERVSCTAGKKATGGKNFCDGEAYEL